jgi:hypothetical protein
MNLKEGIKNVVREKKEFILMFLLALSCTIFFFGKELKNPNAVYFGPTDDGLQAYYGAIYHVKYDTSYWHMNGMNYPYGDQVFFTGCQPLVTNSIKLISKVIDISDYTVGIINIIMLFSVFFCALCLYWIFKHLKLPFLYSAIVAIGISFLSPQIFRLSCHYSLTYQFAIPLFLLLLLKFEEHPTLKKSFLISLLVFFMAGTQFYFLGFFSVLAAFYWAHSFFSKTINFGNVKFTGLHVFIQFVLPFLILQLLNHLTDSVQDRTAYPWGYLTYYANLAGVFYPTGKLYEPIFASFILPEYPPTMEGNAYIGIVALLTFIALIIIYLKNIFTVEIIFNKGIVTLLTLIKLILIYIKKVIFSIFRKRSLITDNKVLTVSFWASIVALIISFGYPFRIKGYEYWLDYVGLFRQMRGIARFAWVFYYVINIIAFYKIYQWVSGKTPIFKNGILFLAVFLLCYDAFYRYDMDTVLNNPIERLADKKNLLPENKWLNEVDINKYQAIITLPYFHVGSENFWMIHNAEIMGDVFITSLKTGLPTISSLMSRTSLSQTFNNIQMIIEPYRKLEILNDFKNKKPFLVLVREAELNADEKRLLSRCKKIKTSYLFNVYELPFEKFEHISDGLYDSTLTTLNKSNLYDIDGFKYSDSTKTFVYNNYYQDPGTKTPLKKKNYFDCKTKEYNLIFYDTLPGFKEDNNEYTVSFWMHNFREDLYPRTAYVLEGISDSTGGSYNRIELGMNQQVRVIDGDSALIEGTIKIKYQKDRLAITVWNNDISPGKTFRVDGLMIRPSDEKIYKVNGNHSIMYNNRIYPAK